MFVEKPALSGNGFEPTPVADQPSQRTSVIGAANICGAPVANLAPITAAETSGAGSVLAVSSGAPQAPSAPKATSSATSVSPETASAVLDGLANKLKALAKSDIKSFDDLKTYLENHIDLKVALDSTTHWIGLHSNEIRILNGGGLSNQPHNVFERLKQVKEVIDKQAKNVKAKYPLALAYAYLLAQCYDSCEEILGKDFKLSDGLKPGSFVYSSEPQEEISELSRGLGGIVRDQINLDAMDEGHKAEKLPNRREEEINQANKGSITIQDRTNSPHEENNKLWQNLESIIGGGQINLHVSAEDRDILPVEVEDRRDPYFVKANELINGYYKVAKI